jgi:hypothetical protein
MVSLKGSIREKSHRVRTVFVIAAASFATGFLLQAEPNFSITPGDVWQYEVTGGTAKSMMIRAVGAEKTDEKELVRLETRIDDALVKTDVVGADEHGLLCYRRTFANGKVASFNPPQLIFPAPLSIGAQWETDELIGESQLSLQFSVVAEEDVEVPAGKFHAWRAQCDQPWPISSTIERWFVPGIGMAKEVVSMRGPNGRLLNRVTSALTKFSRGKMASPGPGPSVMVPSSSPPPLATFKLEIGRDRGGPPATEIKSDAPNIFVRWTGENIPTHAIVRVAWVAADVGNVAPPNFIVDETRTEVPSPTFGARFTLSRPKDGWAAGKYRVDLYLDDQVQATANVTIRD